MTSQLKRIDEKGEILLNDLKAGRINQDQFDRSFRKLIDRAEAILAKKGR
jgi:hypothetical protein